MQRREFLSMTVASAAIGWSSAPCLSMPSGTPLAVPGDSVQEHQRRIGYLDECRRRIRKCLRKQMVINYLPGQVVYNLGEYPCRKPWDPDEWDERQLEQYSQAGVEVVQVHEEWSDSQRLFGADKLSALNEKGFRRFVEMCHRHGLKIIPYISTGYFERNDPDFRQEWATSTAVESYFRYARCSPASAGWRAYLLPRLRRILDHYGVDGFYNDVGYSSSSKPLSSEEEGIGISRESATDAAFEDLLGLVVRRGPSPRRDRQGACRLLVSRHAPAAHRSETLRLLVGWRDSRCSGRATRGVEEPPALPGALHRRRPHTDCP